MGIAHLKSWCKHDLQRTSNKSALICLHGYQYSLQELQTSAAAQLTDKWLCKTVSQQVVHAGLM